MALTEINTDDIVVSLAAGGGSGRSRLLAVSCDGGTTQHFETNIVECDHSPHLARSKMQRAGFDLRSTSITPSPELKASALKQRIVEQGLSLV